VTQRSLTLVFVLAVCTPAVAQNSQEQPSQTPPTFHSGVIETTPLPGVDLPLSAIPTPVQTATAADLANSGATDLSDFLNRRLTNVFVNEMQGNPFQPDVNYRGYAASPLLGTPQGLSVYMDGVRLNQPFGDVVSWDLIPASAIASTTLMPGSNPLFGLNTLGGALALQTKDGRSAKGASAQVIGGAYGRRAVQFEYGGSHPAGADWFVTGNFFHDGGWRDASPSDVRQIFAKVGWRDASTDVHVTGAYMDNALTGNGLQETRLLASDYSSVYTTPDTTNNQATFVNLSARHSLTHDVALSANGYFRRIITNTLNGDVNEDSLDQSLYQPSAADIRALTAAGYTGFPTSGATAANTPFPFWRCIAQVLQRDEPGEKCNGLYNRTSTSQDNYGVSGQMTMRGTPGRVRNQFTAGGAFDRSTMGFVQSSQLGYLNPDRSVTVVAGAFADGVSAGNVDGVPFDNRVSLDGTVRTASAFATDTISIDDRWNATVAGRFNQTDVVNRDRITPSGTGSLTGDYRFSRLNPAAGLTFAASRAVTAFVNYSEGSRAPTSIELGCADPTTPCKLPNALAGDPPLEQVVTRTIEGGIRGTRGRLDWSAGVFRAANTNDLLFVASTQTGFGYFKNFGETRREGVELNLNLHADRLSGGAGYAFTDATYQSNELLSGESNSSADADGTIAIHPGDRIPLIPRHTFKLFADVKATAKLSVDLDVVAASGSVARGNENGAHQPDGVYFLGPGSTPGYGVVNAGARYALTSHVQIIGQVNNLFDTHYYSAAQLGPNGFTAAGTFVARPLPAVNGEFPVVQSTFYAPGAPITGWGGVRVRF